LVGAGIGSLDEGYQMIRRMKNYFKDIVEVEIEK
jgi:hypothetical protein